MPGQWAVGGVKVKTTENSILPSEHSYDKYKKVKESYIFIDSLDSSNLHLKHIFPCQQIKCNQIYFSKCSN